MEQNTKEHVFRVTGMHCASCELLIEKKLLAQGNIKSVEASSGRGQAVIEYHGEKPSAAKLNELLKDEGYTFSDAAREHFRAEDAPADKQKDLFISLAWGLGIILIFLGLNKLGFSGLINVSDGSSLPTFFVFGLIAGISSCAALVGGIILSMSKQWSALYSPTDAPAKKFTPHLLFNFGRLLAYVALGFLLGAIGDKLNLSFKFGPILVIIVSVIMIALALQMLGVKMFRKFQPTAPRFITRYIANETNFKGKYMPFFMGAFTFFLPCGFTITAQSLALLSGNALQGGLIMLFFALGTLPALLAIGLSSARLAQNPRRSARFLKVAGILVLFFALYNINFQLNVLGINSLSDLKQTAAAKSDSAANDKDLAPIGQGKQLLKMNASANGYSPNYFKVRAGIPVRWEITDTGTSGCTNAVISKNLFTGEIPLTPGQTSIKEFTPTKPGRYKFSCWMGMVSGVIDVVEQSDTFGAAGASLIANTSQFAQSGAENQGGSCGTGGGCGCAGSK